MQLFYHYPTTASHDSWHERNNFHSQQLFEILKQCFTLMSHFGSFYRIFGFQQKIPCVLRFRREKAFSDLVMRQKDCLYVRPGSESAARFSVGTGGSLHEFENCGKCGVVWHGTFLKEKDNGLEGLISFCHLSSASSCFLSISKS
mmetsp:Transcript_13010/g.29918  ORF Transcript_13010/g.29918 Transcript_13010/m.29918 type:complete len:145 (-) Transcript_13010:583-1017(-)